MKQQFKVDRFSSLSRDWRTSGWKSHDAFDALIGVNWVSEKIVQCGLVLRSADKSQMCCDVRSVFSVLNQTTQQSVLFKDGSDTLGVQRQAICSMKYSDLLDKDVCVDDAVVFEVEWTHSIASVSYGDPISAPLKTAPTTTTAVFFHKKSMSDITFLVGPDEVAVPANKAVLAQRSSVFQTMFYGSLPETSASIRIPDVHVMALMSLLRYICCMEAVIDKSLIKETLYAADKYDVIDVKQAIGTLADNETIYEIIDYSTSTETKADLLHIKESSLKKDADFLISQRFLSLLPSSVTWIVGVEGWLVDEMKLWTRCVEWAKGKCDRKGIPYPTAADLRTEMLPFLHKFCFPSMTAVDFASGPADSGILNWEEVQDVYKCLHCQTEPKHFPKNRKRPV